MTNIQVCPDCMHPMMFSELVEAWWCAFCVSQPIKHWVITNGKLAQTNNIGWIGYATKTDDYEQIAAVTTEEAREAVNRLFGSKPYPNHTLRWWEFYGPPGDWT